MQTLIRGYEAHIVTIEEKLKSIETLKKASEQIFGMSGVNPLFDVVIQQIEDDIEEIAKKMYTEQGLEKINYLRRKV